MTEIEIFQGSVKEVVDLSVQVPEFDDPHKNQVYHAMRDCDGMGGGVGVDIHTNL